MVCANNTRRPSINNSTTKLQKYTCERNEQAAMTERGERGKMHTWALNPPTGLRQRCAFWWRWVRGVSGAGGEGRAGWSPAAATSLRALTDWAPSSGLSLWPAAQGGVEERNAWSASSFPPVALWRWKCWRTKGAQLDDHRRLFPFISTASRASLMLSSAC